MDSKYNTTFLLNTTFYAVQHTSEDGQAFAIAMGIMVSLVLCCCCIFVVLVIANVSNIDVQDLIQDMKGNMSRTKSSQNLHVPLYELQLVNQQRELMKWNALRNASTLSSTERIEFEKIGATVIEYWIRNIYGCREDFVLDLVLLMVDFTKFPEQFDTKFSHKEITVSTQRDTAGCFNLQDSVHRTAMGEYVAEPGGKYEWKIKLIHGNNVGIGVINSSKCHNRPLVWWTSSRGQGYVWFIGKKQFQSSAGSYAVVCNIGDIVEMYLDLVKCTLSYKVNEKKIGITTDNIVRNEGYRLAIVFQGIDETNMVEIVSLTTR